MPYTYPFPLLTATALRQAQSHADKARREQFHATGRLLARLVGRGSTAARRETAEAASIATPAE